MLDFIDMIESSFTVKAKAIKINNKVVMRAGEFQGVRDMSVKVSGRRW
jgi:hypothetical protein